MLVIKTHYCLPFHKAVIVCLIAVTFGINLLVGLVSQNSFAQDYDTNGDGAVDALDEVTTQQKQLLLMTHPLLLMKSKWIPMVMEQ